MADYRGLDFLDYLVLLVKWKKFFLILAITTFILGYLAVYFLIPPQYKSTAVIVSSEDTPLNPIGAFAKELTNLPISSLGLGNLTSTKQYDLFTTFIYSRSNLEDMIKKFDLINDYSVELMSQARKVLTSNIETDITEEAAYTISVTASSAQKSAKMTNYLLEKINNDVLELKVKKSKNSRVFLEERYNEIKFNLSTAEDSLRAFQQKSGILEAENQIKATIEAYTQLESELAISQMEVSVMKQLYGDNAPQVASAQISADVFSKKIGDLKHKTGQSNLLLPLSSLPANALQYFRYYRNLEIQNAMLKFIIPLYEQARYEEIKDIPVLQIIDHAVPPDKRSFPPRILITIGIMVIITGFAAVYLLVRENLRNTNNNKILFIRKELFNFKTPKSI
ncbi:MAG: Wzz/FepE/Etk N-terminal domain-containing protein [Ignavibacteriaceae bacterium]